MMDCDTTGVEPDFVGQGRACRRRRDHDREQDRADGALRAGYALSEAEVINAFIDERNTIVGAPYVKTDHYPVFDCAIGDRAIHYMGHVKMMGAVQPFISGAISKTVNLPEEVTVDEISQLLIESWQLGVKAIAIYRDNCKVARSHSGKADAGATTLSHRSPASSHRSPSGGGSPTTASRSAASSRSASTRATSTSASSTTGRPATSSSWTSRGHDARRPHELVHDLRLARPPVRRAARGVRLGSSATCASSPRA